MKMRRQRQLKRTKRHRKSARKNTRKMRGGSLIGLPADAIIAKDGSLMSVEDALGLSTEILHKD